MKKFEYFDVTADIGFYAFGKNLNEAFENAGLAIFNIISNTDNINPQKSIEFEITSEDEVSLLYDYLEELLFYHEVEFMLFSEFIIEIEKTDDDYHLKAIIKGEDINWDKHERDCEIKAITFHQMEVNMSDDVWLKAIVDL
ncbi:archease [Methanobrevibacter millerae]|uniref:Protein archease n=1 Tax=Methanobrevibacter millerae TaxID=230361 RepID=A0A0U3CUQ8_9EURY|nr:archease [Methanobrevibacter millerae]ALT68100.1 archease [Methanobrevibacter millerae]MBO6274956.1 archease [Methanobrevibacter sp.]MBP3226367.1 archease [Methanobrevibacter sp.]